MTKDDRHKLARTLKRHGLELKHDDEFRAGGEYMVKEIRTGIVVSGDHYELTIPAIQEMLRVGCLP